MSNTRKKLITSFMITAFSLLTTTAYAEVTKKAQPSAQPTTKEVPTGSDRKDRPHDSTKDRSKTEVGSSAYSVGAILLTSISPTISTRLSSDTKKDKIIVYAKNDAATFVATQGEVKGAYLEAAINEVRKITIAKGASDMDVAKAILAW